MGGSESRNESRPHAASVSAPPRARLASSASLPGSLADRKPANLGHGLKSFLRDSNLSGLEYRLRLAGYYTMEDLLKTNEDRLKASGLTPLMTSRLIKALTDYHRNKPRSAAPLKPVRQGANIRQIPPQEALAIRKRNVKRTTSQGQSTSDNGPPPRNAAQVKLLSPADTPDAHFVARYNSSDQLDGAASRRWSIAVSKGSSLQSSLSLPEGLCACVATTSSLPIRSYSCPVVVNCPPSFSASSSLAEAVLSEDYDEAAQALKLLCQTYSQQPELKTVLSGFDCLELTVKALQLWYEDVSIAERGCRFIKLLTRGRCTIPSGAMLAVLDAMCSHPNEVRVQLQAYLAAANIGRAAPQSCKAVVFRGGMSAVVAGTERFYDNFSIQIAGLSLLSVAFAGEPEGRLKFLTEHARSVDWVITSMKLYGQNIALMEGSCAFFALLMVGVCHQMECTLLLLVVEQVLRSMNAFPQCEALQVWGCKVIAHVTTASDLLSDPTLAVQCVQAVIGTVMLHRTAPAVQTWGAYALYQIISSSTLRASTVITAVHRDTLVELCRGRAAGLTEEANMYLSYLQTVLEM